MGYQALLFCADEKLARVVSQVFTELEFNIEQVNEPFSAVKKLMAQHFDAIVVDCENEQNASLIFKSARNSTSNQSSLALALVEGQSGVAKAYRIGANLVLTKPINVEQAKGTLRVARGLLRKNADATSKAQSAAEPGMPAATVAKPESLFAAPAFKASLPEEPGSVAQFSSEHSPESRFHVALPAPEFEAASIAASAKADEHAVEIPGPKADAQGAKDSASIVEPVVPEISKPSATPVHQEAKPVITFAGLQGAAAAPAPAKEKISAPPKTKAVEQFQTSSSKSQTAEVIAAPTFSAIGEPASERPGGNKTFLVIAAVAVVAIGLGYAGWTKFGGRSTSSPTRSAVPSAQLPALTSPATATPSNGTTPAAPSQSSAPSMTQSSKPQPGASTAPITKIAVGAEETKPEVVTRTFEPAPIHVKTQAPAIKVQRQADESALPVPDPLAVGSSKDTNLASLVSGPARLPAAPMSTLKISQGVSQGLLIKKVQPTYPPSAKSMRVEGAVDMEATIDKEGKIRNLKVVKGQTVLAHAAVEAVRQWRYKPYYLDGEPVEIQTQITIVFRLPN